jgi:DNA-binding SARP family transcriptional activator
MDVLLLGPIEARLDGRTIPLGAHKQRALLALLALHVNQPVSSERIVAGLWGEEPPHTAPKMVQNYVSQLRRLLPADGTAIVTRGGGYELRTPADAVDAARFERLIAEQRPREALALWRGDPLGDVIDEPFAAVEARRLEELRLRAMEQAVDADLADGRHAEALGRLEPLVAEHPLRERLQAQRMLALYRAGRQAEALEAYRAARHELVERMGVEPCVELRRLHDAILHQDAALAAPRRRRRPVARTRREPPPPAPRRARRRRPRAAAVAAVAVVCALLALGVARVARGHDRGAGIEVGAPAPRLAHARLAHAGFAQGLPAVTGAPARDVRVPILKAMLLEDARAR